MSKDLRKDQALSERLQLLEAIIQGLEAAEKGDLLSHQEVMRKLDELLKS